ncbi:MAG: SurA N-terminal domain-containing protein [Patescibacteria group bacterium]|nr:SurA N-terminal domain-containing protein [Patescibacteria group bacterium]
MNKATQKIIAISAALLLVIILTVSAGLAMNDIYTKQSESSSARFVSKAFSLPAANVNGKSIKYDRFLQTRDAVRKFINSDAGKDVGATMPPEKELNENILEQLIRQKLVESLAEEKGISVSNDEVSETFNEVAAQAASTTESTITEYLQDNYGWNEQNFRDYVLKPALLEQKVASEVGTEADPYAMENLLLANRQKPEVVVYLRFE